MSYDLFFRCRKPGNTISREDFDGYFDGLDNYKIDGAEAWYSNEDTGVYFTFDFSDQSDDDEDEERVDKTLAPISFNINYLRPHPFGLEADAELQMFVNHFELKVSDPQINGMGDGEYSSAGFLRGWNAGNEFAYRAMLSQDPKQDVLSLPSAKLRQYWTWNDDRGIVQDEMVDSGFVPKLFFFNVNGKVKTGVAWGDGIPVLLPEVDLVLMPRQRLASKGDDIVMATWQELLPLLERFPKVEKGLQCRELFFEETPADIEKWIRSRKPPAESPKEVGFDQILDEDLLEKARSS